MEDCGAGGEYRKGDGGTGGLRCAWGGEERRDGGWKTLIGVRSRDVVVWGWEGQITDRGAVLLMLVALAGS